jgi:uncharacterized protein
MPLSMYQASIPVFMRGLDLLTTLLKKAEAHESSVSLIEARLAPDMLTIVGQVQRATDTAKGCAARLAGVDVPSFPDTEKTYADLHARIARTKDFLQGIKRAQVDGSDGTAISFKGGPNTFNFTGESYLLTFVLPNFFFHLTTAYGILRHKGVALGKMDYLGHDLIG